MPEEREIVLEDKSKLAFSLQDNGDIVFTRVDRLGKAYSSQPLKQKESQELKEAFETISQKIKKGDLSSVRDSIWISPKNPNYLYSAKVSFTIFAADSLVTANNEEEGNQQTKLATYVRITDAYGHYGRSFFIENPQHLHSSLQALDKLLKNN